VKRSRADRTAAQAREELFPSPQRRRDTSQGTLATYFTDASVLGRVVAGAPIVVWGPGTPAVMHAVDEYVELAELEEAAALFTAVAAGWPP
jgi:acetylornithine deacetylase/succinyl-diaminopimelate desuccinylase-like protein